jgi:hypothetical protein
MAEDPDDLADRTRDHVWMVDDACDQCQAWIEALHSSDYRGDDQPLIELMRSETHLSPFIRDYLADWISRRQSKPGRPRTPAYTLSKIEGLLFMASEEVRGLVRRRVMGVEDAIDWVASKCKIDPTTLSKHYKRTRGQTNRKRAAPALLWVIPKRKRASKHLPKRGGV